MKVHSLKHMGFDATKQMHLILLHIIDGIGDPLMVLFVELTKICLFFCKLIFRGAYGVHPS